MISYGWCLKGGDNYAWFLCHDSARASTESTPAKGKNVMVHNEFEASINDHCCFVRVITWGLESLIDKTTVDVSDRYCVV